MEKSQLEKNRKIRQSWQQELTLDNQRRKETFKLNASLNKKSMQLAKKLNQLEIKRES